MSSEYPYHVTARSHNKLRFQVPLDELWKLFCYELYFTQKSFNLIVHSFVLMPNHYHLLVSTPDANLDKAMQWFMRETAKKTNLLSGQINQLWGGRYFRCLVNSQHYFMNVRKYVYRNPVEAHLCERIENYPYSTAHGLLGHSKLIIEAFDDELVHYPNENLMWLNRSISKQHREYIRLALQKRVFKLPKVESRSNPLETELI